MPLEGRKRLASGSSCDNFNISQSFSKIFILFDFLLPFMNSKDEAKERKKDKEDKNQSKKGLFHISWII